MVFWFIIIWVLLFPFIYRALGRLRTDTLFKENSGRAIIFLYLLISLALSFLVSYSLYTLAILIESVF